MPNWCNNYIEVRGSNAEEIKRLADAFDAGELCDAVIPVPQALKDTVAGSHGDEDKQKALEQQEAENLAQHGAKNWYDFCVSHWGTKWDVNISNVCDRDDDGLGFQGSFDSAWSPPMGVVQKMVDDGLEVVLHYNEPGMAFVGKFDNGDDEYYQYDGETSKTVRAAIGDEMDDFWCISENMAEYEDEEELTAWVKDGAESRAKNEAV
jgi:hypothetical protein